MNGSLIYKCKRCGALTEISYTNDVEQTVRRAIFDGKLFITHTCRNNCIGVCELIGGGVEAISGVSRKKQ